MFRVDPESCGHRPIILAVSGGPDSMALAAHATDWQNRNPNMSIRAVIIDHGIRQDSSQEAVMVKGWLKAMGLKAKIITVSGSAPKTGVQSWAREKRYSLLADDARVDGAVLMVAHHADDQAETVAMRLAAGSGLAGLRGMEAQSFRRDVTIVRPFLDMPRDELHRILEEQNIPYSEDPSNKNENFERIAWRARWAHFKAEGLTKADFLRLQSAASKLHEIVRGSIRKSMAGHWARVPCGALWMDRDNILRLPSKAAVILLRAVGGRFGQSKWPMSHESAQTLLSALKNRNDDGIAMTVAGLEWYCRGDIVWVYLEAERPMAGIRLTRGSILYDDVWQIRSAIEGEIMSMGEMRAAEMRKIAPQKTAALLTGDKEKYRAPMRALWRLPVIKPAHSHQDDLITLEDGAMIPHLNKEKVAFSAPSDSITMSDCRPNGLI